MTREVLGFGIGAILINAAIIGILLYYALWSVMRGSAPGIGFWLQLLIVLAVVVYLLFEEGFVIFSLLRLM